MSELRRMLPPGLVPGDSPERVHEQSEPVRRTDGSAVDTSVIDQLMVEFVRRRVRGEWDADRASSDRWLAPRLHYSLRLSRREAGDRFIWSWLAHQHAEIVQWRWDVDERRVADDRRLGPIHKQAFARLWWGAELFRDGADYGPVRRAFVLQDLPNSYLHRPMVRCRSLALGLVDVLVPPEQETTARSAGVNDLARVLNLVTAGSPPEIETGFQQDDRAAFMEWTRQVPVCPESWESMPPGPPASDTTPTSLAGGRAIAERGREIAERSRRGQDENVARTEEPR